MPAETFESLALKAHSLQRRLDRWSARLANRKYHAPTIKCEWDRTFDAREAVKTRLCRMDRAKFKLIYPDEPNDR